MKIAITTSSFGVFTPLPLELCTQAGFAYTLNPYGRVLTEDEASALYADCIGVLAGTEPITAKVMRANPHLRVISRCGVGLDAIDKDYAAAQGIQILSTPDVPTQATAEHTLTLMLALLRKTAVMAKDMHGGVWKKKMGHLLHKKKVGLIGYGRIGKAVAKMLHAFDCQIACHDPFIQTHDYPQYELPKLLAWADIISLHCSSQKNDNPIVTAEAIASMRPHTWIINTARGGLVDDVALYHALETGHLAGVALDVFGQEPYQGCLLQHEKALLTPHVSSYAQEARVEMEMQAMQNLIQALADV